MKIGILTYHRTLNYGACLQAMATRIIIENLGYEAYYVDYWPEYHSQFYSAFSLEKLIKTRGIKSKMRLLYEALLYGRYQDKRRENFNKFIAVEIAPFCRPLSEKYEVVIYGSDQIWRKQPLLNKYNPIYFADGSIVAKKHIAFSASMGVMPTTLQDKELLSTLLNNFDAISVRENELKIYCQQITKKQVHLTLDPTLLLPANVWQDLLPIAGYNGPKYVLVYALHNTFSIKEVNDFANKHGLSVKVIYGTTNKRESDAVITTAGPIEFLRLINNADVVFSASFHGLAFSLLFKKEFFVSFDNNAGRVKSLLAEVGLSERFIAPMSQIPTNVIAIDYDKVGQKLELLRAKSYEYLKDSLR